MFMTGFNQETVRFGALDLVGEWRRFTILLILKTQMMTKPDLDVLAVNVQENGRCPVNYIYLQEYKEQLYNNNTLINQNEQSLSLRVSGDGLEPEDSRAF
jgi:cell surface protein SprA